jgi:hypothetical protein
MFIESSRLNKTSQYLEKLWKYSLNFSESYHSNLLSKLKFCVIGDQIAESEDN